MEALLVANQSRGTDSTGIASIQPTGEYDIIKDVLSAEKFVNTDIIGKTLRKQIPLTIGHTRMTSMGNDVVKENAHPFVEGNIIGAHNGVINNYMELDGTVRVDSQAVFRMLDEYPDGMDWVFQQVSGSCTLTWWDARDPNAMYLVSHLNPLNVGIVSGIDTMFWSSEMAHLYPVLRAAFGKDIVFMPIKQDTVYRVDSTDLWGWQEFKVNFKSWSDSRGSVFGRGYSVDDEDAWVNGGYVRKVGQSDVGKAQAVAEAMLPTVIHDDEDKYNLYWERLGFRSGSDENSDEQDEDYANSKREKLSSSQFRVYDDGGADMTCGYCMDPIVNQGVYDSVLDMTLCDDCVKWSEKYSDDSIH